MITDNHKLVNKSNQSLQKDEKILSDPALIHRGIAQQAYDLGWRQGRQYGRACWFAPMRISVDNDETVTRIIYKRDHHKYGKRGWFEGNSTRFYFAPNITHAIASHDGIVYVAAGETDYLSYLAAGIRNVIGLNGETMSRHILPLLEACNVKQVIYAPDNDNPGLESATALRDTIYNADIDYKPIDLSEHVNRKGDTNDVWIATKFDSTHFIDVLHRECKRLNLPAYNPPKTETFDFDTDETDTNLVETIARFLGVHDWKTNQDGWTKKLICNPLRNDRHPTAGYNMRSGVLNDFGGRTYSPYELAEYFGIPYKKPSRSRSSTGNTPTVSLEDRVQAVTIPPLSNAHMVSVPYWSELENDPVWDSQRIIAAKGATGSGKSTVVDRLNKKMGDNVSVLGMTPSEALTQSLAAKTGMDSYKDILTAYLPSTPQLAICAPSMPKLITETGGASHRNRFWMDEFDQILGQFKSRQLYGNNAGVKTYEAIKETLKHSNQTIITSATITDTDIDILKLMTGRDVHVIENTYRHKLPNLKIYEHGLKLIEDGLRMASQTDDVIFMPFASKRMAKIAERLAIDTYGLAEDDIFCLTGDNSATVKAQQIIQNPNEEIPKLKLFIYTFSVGVGFDYTGSCAGVYGHFSNRDMTPLQYIQMMRRARHARKYRAYVRLAIESLETDPKAIYAKHMARVNYTNKRVNAGVLNVSIAQQQLLWIQCLVEAKDNTMRNDSLGYFAAYARQQGHDIETNSTKSNAFFASLVSEARDAIKAETKYHVCTQEPVTARELEFLRASSELEERHIYGRKRDVIEQTIGVEITAESYDLFHAPTSRSQLVNFTNVFALSIESAQDRDRTELADGVNLRNMSHETEQTLLGREFLMALTGAKTFSQVPNKLRRIAGTKRDFVAMVKDYLTVNRDRLETFFNYRPDLSNSDEAFVTRIINRLGLRLACIGRESSADEHGKRQRIYGFDHDRFEIMKRYAMHRRKHLATLGTDENPLSQIRNTNNSKVSHVCDGLPPDGDTYERNQRLVDAIPI